MLESWKLFIHKRPREKGKSEIPGVKLDKLGNIVKYDFEMQCHSVFKNINTVLLDSARTILLM